MDLQKAHTAADAVVELSIAAKPHRSLWGKVAGVFSSIFGQVTEKIEAIELDEVKISLRSSLNSGNWQAKGDRIFEILASADRPVVIFFDEVPILVNRILKGSDYHITPERRQDADAFLSWLRANSIRHAGKIRQVITGSIGLEPILRQAGLNATLNNYTPLDLGPWSPEITVGCLEALANQYNLTFQAGAAERVVDRLGYCIPHHVQMFFNNIYRSCRDKEVNEISVELVDEVYESSMLSIRGNAELSHMEERLRVVLGPEIYPLALELLTETSITGRLTPSSVEILSKTYAVESRSREDIVREILGILEHDGYLYRRDQDTYMFLSNLLKDWWKSHFGFGFKPAAER